MNLTPHFTLEELTASDTAARLGINNSPNQAVVLNLHRLAAKLEEVRSLLAGVAGREISLHINSGYRSPELNAAIGGSNTSAHPDGRAGDFIAPRFGAPYDVARAIRDAGIVFDQLIYEHTWVHIGIATIDAAPRQQCLTLKPGGGYVAGIVLKTDIRP